MEIINCIQAQPRQKSRANFLITTKKNNNRNRSSLRYETKSSYVVTKTKKQISLKQIFTSIGQTVTEFEYFFYDNAKKLLIILGIFLLIIATCVGGIIFAKYSVNHTGPLELNNSKLADVESLDKIMSHFATDITLSYDSNGNLIDTNSTQNTSSVNIADAISYQTYTVKSGDTISGICVKFGLKNISTVIAVNNISNVRQLYAGQKLTIPSADGTFHVVKKGENLSTLVEKYKISLETLLDVNELSSDELSVGQKIFIPGATLDAKTLRQAMGETFKIPITAKFRWTSPYGARIDPIKGTKSYHKGTDMACPTGTPVYASLYGRVSFTGVSNIYGNYVIISHDNGYQTLYAHLSKILTKKGQWVEQGSKIGLVGNTGYSTGPHLHFSVYKNGKSINPMSVIK